MTDSKTIASCSLHQICIFQGSPGFAAIVAGFLLDWTSPSARWIQLGDPISNRLCFEFCTDQQMSFAVPDNVFSQTE